MVTRRVAARAAAITAACAWALAPASASAATAPDPLAGQAWQLEGDGPMGIASAWDRTTGGDVIVAVLDSGADLTHPDLVDNLWTNAGEVPGNGVDDDHDGLVDDVHGADLLHGDGDPTDDNGHGTHVAGIIGARGGNAEGSAGIAWRVRIMPIKVLDDRAVGTPDTVAAGLRYAVAHGARIVNVSLAGPRPSQALRDAIDLADRAGVLVVAAAGNTGNDVGVTPSYPVAYPAANVLGVAATQRDGALVPTSSWGGAVELAAPGQDILSTARGGGYELRTGTSVAAPMVSGAAALLASAQPGTDARTLRAALVGSARATSLPGGERALDVGAALQWVPPSAPTPTPAASPRAAVPARAVLPRMPRSKAASPKAAKGRAARARHARHRHVARRARDVWGALR